ncbi:SGNH/GDSL hydrolase family protein [Cephaloticoccus primus]|nr:SGNH/GDSL hydrolase family protein [Cephaloticoccus primus]
MLIPPIAPPKLLTATIVLSLRSSLLQLLVICLIALAPRLHATIDTQADEHFVATWATTILPIKAEALDDTILIQNVRISAGGDRARLHLSNLYGESELVIAAASLALLPEGHTKATEPKAQHTPLTFGGQSEFTIPAGQNAVSDPIDFPVSALSDVAITLHIKKAPERYSGHGSAPAVSRSFYRSTQAPHSAQYERVRRWFFIHALDVTTTAPRQGAIVLLGDSITDGGGGPASHLRWGDELARRLHGTGKTNGIGVVNKGVSGNRLLREGGRAPSALDRFERDVLQTSGARWVIVHIGINDCGTLSRQDEGPPPTVSEFIAAYEQLIDRAHAAGLKVYGSTLLPFKGAGYWTEIGEEYRKAINEWVRNHAPYDAIIDFDAALRDPDDPDYLAEHYDGGDYLHPFVTGLHAMAHAIDLGLFDLDK